MRISYWSSDVCSSDLLVNHFLRYILDASNRMKEFEMRHGMNRHGCDERHAMHRAVRQAMRHGMHRGGGRGFGRGFGGRHGHDEDGRGRRHRMLDSGELRLVILKMNAESPIHG